MGTAAPQAAGVYGYVGDTLGITNTGVGNSSAGQSASKFLGFGAQGMSLNEQLARTPKPVQPTTKERIVSGELADEKRAMARRRASSTLFTGGQGVLDNPSVASSVLLGV